MYEYISGELVESGENFAVVDVGGIAYRLKIPSSTASTLRDLSQVRLYTSTRLRDEHFHIYGFATPEERAIFEKICTVSGIGPGTALAILSGVPIEQFRIAVLSGQAQILQEVRGVGKKTAERLILELKEIIGLDGGTTLVGVLPRKANDAVAALVALGFSAGHAEGTVRRAVKQLPDDATLEDVIKMATRLQRVSG